MNLNWWANKLHRIPTSKYSKICVKQPLKKDKTKILMKNGSIMKAKALQNILQYFWPALSDTLSWETIFGLFESGHLTQVLLYLHTLVYGKPIY